MTRQKINKSALFALSVLVASFGANSATTDLATSPIVTSYSSSVKPNVLFVLDDSGSMGWDFLPDWACASTSATNSSCSSTGEDPNSARNDYWFRSSDYNGVYYNPANKYTPPAYFNSDGVTADTTTYPSQTGLSTAAGADSAAKPNWNAVKNDAYGSISGTSNLAGQAYFYTIVPGEYCTSSSLKSCNTQAASAGSYTVAAPLRWCNSSGLTTCQGAFNSASGFNFTYAKAPAPMMATITISGSSSAIVSGITINTKQILSAATGASSTSSTVASNIVTAINNCSFSLSGNCTTVGYRATRSGSTVTIWAPGVITTTPAVTPVVTLSGMTASTTAFVQGTVPGYNLLTAIVPSITSYPFPGTSVKGVDRTDCAGTTCTYAEEMTNFANWWTYYRTRMQAMKTASSLAFSPITGNFRIGYMSINNNTNSDFLNIDTFSSTQKYNWYNKFFAANPGNSTPLRTALTKAGRLYAGQLSTLNSVTVIDPVQYSCQQNFTILSTDGYWNESSNPTQINGSTAIGNQDSAEPRPMNDGGYTTGTAVTPTVTITVATTPRTVVDRKTRTDTTTTTSAASRVNTYTRTKYVDSGGGCGSGKRKYTTTTYTGNSTETQTTSNNSLQLKEIITTSDFSDVATTTLTSTRTVVTTNGVVTSDTTSNTTTGPTTVSTPVSSSSVTNNVGSPTTNVTGPVSSFSPTITGSSPYTGPGAISWTVTSGPSTAVCMTNPSSLDTYVLASNGSFGTAVAGGPTTTTGTLSSSTSGYPQTTTGTTTTVVTGPTVGTTTTTTASVSGTSNTLADVAEYYYKTDLRTPALANCTGVPVSPATTGNTLCSTPVAPVTLDPYNNVPTSGSDSASWQHMTTFTMGLGASGFMQYSPTYATDSSGDFFSVKQGASANSASGICSWQTSGACNWPVPVSNSQTTIDDLWHAAVDGRGTYFSASNPKAISSGLSNALSGVTAKTGGGAAATTSTPNVTTDDNYVFSSVFRSAEWNGDIYLRLINVSDGSVSSTNEWSAQAQLDTLPYTSRNIYTYSASATNHVKTLTWTNLTSTEQAYFSQPAINTLSQFACALVTNCLSAANQALAAGSPLLNFVRGDRSNEEGTTTDNLKYFRYRVHVLGDIVDSEAAYVAAPRFSYGDWGYSSFVTANKLRQPMVYVGANDGMLHAFYAACPPPTVTTVGTVTTTTSNCNSALTLGSEAWAYVPSFVMPNLYSLADKNYSNPLLHKFYVDGTPVAGDICISNCATPANGATTPVAVWKTILVGGLNAGGRGYYALDISDPTSAPKVLWEFTDTDMGYTYGNPKIAKLKDGTWVVLLTSGYNNVAPGDGQGRLYILNAYTGALIRKIATGVGSDVATVTGCSAAPCPSGLAKIAAQVVNTSTDNTILAVYGGDLYGNLWRFDVNNDIGAAGYDAHLLATLRGPSPANNVQPITSKPDIGIVNGKPIILVGTGSLLGLSDIGDTSKQSFYGIKDIQVPDPNGTGTTGSPSYGNPRTYGGFVQQTLTLTQCPDGTDPSICLHGELVVTGTNNAVNLASNNGWYIDFPSTGERVNTDPILVLGTILFNTNIPGSSACELGGSSFQYFLNYATGGPVNSQANGVISVKLDNSLATRPVVIQLPNGNLVSLTVVGNGEIKSNDVQVGSGSGAIRRVSWRELTTDQ